MDEEKDIGFFAIIPMFILERNDVTATAKLMYAAIMGLARKTGYCYASNDFLAMRMGMSTRSVTRPIVELQTKGLIEIHLEKFPGGTKRKIWMLGPLRSLARPTTLPSATHDVSERHALSVDNIVNKKRDAGADFQRFWDCYPRHEGKKKAREIWMSKKPPIEEILAFVEKAKETDRWRAGYIKHPTTFLRGECWEDDLASYNDRKKEVIEIKRYK